MSDAFTEDALRQLKLPPHSMEAEQSVIGGLLLDNSVWDRIADFLVSDDFYRDEHRLIFTHCTHLLHANSPADIVTVSESLSNTNEFERAGGLSYLSTIVQNTPTAANIRKYAEIVKDKALLRGLISIGNTIIESAYAPDGRGPHDLLDEAGKKVFELAETGTRSQSGFVSIKPVLDEVLEKIQEMHESGAQEITGVPSGFIDLDKMTSGLQSGDLVVVAGRPSMGKTAFAMNIAQHIAVLAGLPVGIFSMEMSSTQLVMRMLSSVGLINQQRMRIGQLNDEEWERLTYAFDRLYKAPIHIDESASLNTYEVRARARRLHRHYGGKLGLIIVDYLQLMSSGFGRRTENRATEISDISRSLKSLAREVACPVLALSQLSRKVEERGDKHPMMTDLRESGAIEQDADLILMLYRDEYYNKETRDKGVAEIIVGKQRNGPTGAVRLSFRGDYMRFANLATREYGGPP